MRGFPEIASIPTWTKHAQNLFRVASDYDCVTFECLSSLIHLVIGGAAFELLKSDVIVVRSRQGFRGGNACRVHSRPPEVEHQSYVPYAPDQYPPRSHGMTSLSPMKFQQRFF